jgi:hypothetical protein
VRARCERTLDIFLGKCPKSRLEESISSLVALRLAERARIEACPDCGRVARDLCGPLGRPPCGRREARS